MTNTPTNRTLADALKSLNGQPLSSVEFVADYVQLRFDGPTLTAYTPPTLSSARGTHVWREPGYTDVLLRQIGCRVKHTAVTDEQILIDFENGAAVSISLRDDDYRGPEALQFSLDQNQIWVA